MQEQILNDPIGTAIPIVVVLVAAFWVSNSRLPAAVKKLAYTALVLRLVGTWGRYYMVTDMYNNTGDSFEYFRWGMRYAGMLWAGDIQGFLNENLWSGDKWWGTQFVRYISGVIITFTGPSFIGSFLMYSLLALIGLIGFGMAFHRSYPDVPATNYIRWIWLFPSLWFWPSAIGKESIILMGLGLATWGFVGKGGKVNWLLLAAGVFLVFAIRVQVAAVLVVSLIIGHWLSLGGRWTLGRVLQGVVILGIGIATTQMAMQQMGVESFDVEGVQGYLEENTGRGGASASPDNPNRRGAGSSVEGVAVGLGGVPVALMNILVRPFPWEARNVQLMITSLEIFGFWAIVIKRRRTFMNALRNWRSDKLLRLAMPFILVYSITLGMLLSNMGLIARQRILLFPFLFLLVEAVPRVAGAAQRATQTPSRPASLARPRPIIPKRAQTIRG